MGGLILWLGLAGAAQAAEADRATTSLGAQWIVSPPTDDVAGLNLLLAERARWTLAEGDAAAQFRVNARFTIDPLNDTVLERARVRELSVRVKGDRMTWDIGRSPVYKGGAIIVDGVQGTGRLSDRWEAGAWLGAAPDLYTTIPRARFGGGPILAWEKPKVQASLVGELLYAEGWVDRAGALLQGRYSALPRVEVDTRLALQLPYDGASPVSDGMIFARWTPSDALRLDAFYNAYSAPWYISTADLDPALQRFAVRSEALGLTEDIPQDSPDPTLHQLVGFSARVDGDAVRWGLDVRGRHHLDPDRQYARINPRVTFKGLYDGRMELTADAALLYANLAPRAEIGFAGWVEPWDEGAIAFDSSLRLLYSEIDGLPAPGFYADGYVDWINERGWVMATGVFTSGDLDDDFMDVAFGGLVRLSWRVRGD